MGNTRGMFSANNLPPGVTKLGKPASFYFFKRKPTVQNDRYELWRGVADLLGFTTQERLRKANSDDIIHLCLE